MQRSETGKDMTGRALVFVLVVSALFGWYGMSSDLPYSRTASEVEMIKIAVKFGSGDLNPHCFPHPPFFAYLLFFLYGIFFLIGKLAGSFNSVADFQRLYFTDPTAFYLISRYAVLAMGSASIAVFYVIGKKLFDGRTALMAASLMALSPVYIKLSHYGAPDIPMLLMASCALYFTVNIFNHGRPRDYVFAGIFFGLSMAAKFGAGLLAAPILTAHLLSPCDKSLKGKFINIKLPILFLSFILGMFLGNPYAFIEYKMFFATFSTLSARMSDISYNFNSWKADKPGWIYILTDTMPYGLGYLPTIFIIFGLLYALYRRKREDILLVSLILTAYILIGRWDVIKPRYFIFVFPFGFLLGARFVTEMLKKARISGRAMPYFLSAIFILLVIEPLSDIVKFDKAVSRTPVYIQAKNWIESNVPNMSAVANFTGISTVPLVPNEASIDRSLAEIKKKKMGEGVMLKTLKKHPEYFPKRYDIYELPYPWREDYDDEDFNFKRQVKGGVKYFIFTQEIEEYYASPGKYGTQVKYVEDVKKGCSLVKEFRQYRPKVEPGYIGDDEYILIYRYRG